MFWRLPVLSVILGGPRLLFIREQPTFAARLFFSPSVWKMQLTVHALSIIMEPVFSVPPRHGSLLYMTQDCPAKVSRSDRKILFGCLNRPNEDPNPEDRVA